MVLVENSSLHGKYSSRIEKLKRNSNIIDVEENTFRTLFKSYCNKHLSMQRALSKATQYKNSESWLNDEANQALPLFIWDSNFTKEEKALELIEQSDLEIKRNDIKDCSTYEYDENKRLPYEEGDIVLSASHKGECIKFEAFDRIIYVDGTHYIYSFKKKRYKYPFKLDSIKKELKAKIIEWYKEEVIEIHRDDIKSLLSEC